MNKEKRFHEIFRFCEEIRLIVDYADTTYIILLLKKKN